MENALETPQATNGPLTDHDPIVQPPFALLFARRLHRLVTIRTMSSLTSEQRRLVDHALYSTYWDCARAGLRAEARLILGMPPG